MSLQELFMPMSTAKMKPSEFLSLTDKQKENISSAKFVAPKLGDSDFGRFSVEFKMPVLRGTK